MELRDFVSESLVSIVMGVQEAQQLLRGQNAATEGLISPAMPMMMAASPEGIVLGPLSETITTVQFDVAITVAERTGDKGGIQVAAVFLKAGGQMESASQNESVSRLKFAVPVRLPTTDPETEAKIRRR